MRLLGPVAAQTFVSSHFPADGRFVSVHQLRDRTLTMIGFDKNRNLVAFVLGEMCIGHFGQLRRRRPGAGRRSHLAHLTD